MGKIFDNIGIKYYTFYSLENFESDDSGRLTKVWFEQITKNPTDKKKHIEIACSLLIYCDNMDM